MKKRKCLFVSCNTFLSYKFEAFQWKTPYLGTSLSCGQNKAVPTSHPHQSTLNMMCVDRAAGWEEEQKGTMLLFTFLLV